MKLKNTKIFLLNQFDKLVVLRKKIGEINKFKDKRRKKIYGSVKLSKKEKKEINQFYKENYGKKIPLMWHRHYMAYTGCYDKNYFPELLYIPEFEYYMNYDKGYCRVFEDKSILPIFANLNGIKMPNIIVQCVSGTYRDANFKKISNEQVHNILYNIGECFAKPSIDSCSGKGCMLLNIKNGVNNDNKSISELLNDLGENFIIQNKIVCHDDISKIYSGSVNTFRIITYKWKDKIYHTPSIMRIGKGGNYLDNAHAGGIFIAIDDDGTLHKTAFTEFKDMYTEHPDTKFVFDKFKIEGFPKVLKAAEHMHDAIPRVGVVNWDFTIDKNGDPILIEANLLDGGIWVVQMAHGKGPFGNNTAEILKWLNTIKKVKKSERTKYSFGKTDENNNGEK